MENSYINKLVKEIDFLLENKKNQFSHLEIEKLKKARQDLIENKGSDVEDEEENFKRRMSLFRIVAEIIRIFLENFP